MAEADEQAKLRSYLAAQSAKLPAAEIRARLDEAAQELLAALAGADDARAHRRPAPGEWSVAEIVDHVAVTLEDVLPLMRTLAGGARPAQGMVVSHAPANAAAPLAALLERLRRGQAAVSDFLAAQGGEPHTDLRVADGYFGEINWKGYALILRLHYRDHARQVARTLAAV